MGHGAREMVLQRRTDNKLILGRTRYQGTVNFLRRVWRERERERERERGGGREGGRETR
jgi:hypothetical protein